MLVTVGLIEAEGFGGFLNIPLRTFYIRSTLVLKSKHCLQPSLDTLGNKSPKIDTSITYYNVTWKHLRRTCSTPGLEETQLIKRHTWEWSALSWAAYALGVRVFWDTRRGCLAEGWLWETMISQRSSTVAWNISWVVTFHQQPAKPLTKGVLDTTEQNLVQSRQGKLSLD